MSEKSPPNEFSPGSLRTYVTGFALSLGLTLAGYLLVLEHAHTHHRTPSDNWAMAALSVLAITQLIVQLICFLHLGRESKPRWNLTVLLFAALVVFIIVFGSVWIMINLNYHHANGPSGGYIIHDEGFGQQP